MITQIANSQHQTPLERFLGVNAQVQSRELVTISRNTYAEWLEASFPTNEQPDEQGRLHLFPIDDNKFCMQLLYLQYAESMQSDTATVCCLHFMPGFFEQYSAEVLMNNQPFRLDETTEQQFSICAQTRALLDQLQQKNILLSFTNALQQNEFAAQLLRRALQSITLPYTTAKVPACRFLANDSERDKVMEARLIIEQHLDQPLTIRELSRKVAMNECYLKKGFKTLVGRTIHEYQQELRINKAKELLQQQGRSVSDVANTLGYSSISHFSTAFKKATGMKPCELLA